MTTTKVFEVTAADVVSLDNCTICQLASKFWQRYPINLTAAFMTDNGGFGNDNVWAEDGWAEAFIRDLVEIEDHSYSDSTLPGRADQLVATYLQNQRHLNWVGYYPAWRER